MQSPVKFTFFQSITTPKSFAAISLDDRTTTFDIEFSSSTTHYTFGAKRANWHHLSIIVNPMYYLKPLSRYFATFNSLLYQPEIPQSGCQSLMYALGFK
jgi:hypothetical protein